MIDLVADYAVAALAVAFSALGAVGTWAAARWGIALAHRDMLQRAWTEVKGAVMEVAQSYTNDIKLGRADGTLTDQEKSLAKVRAIGIARANLGTKGLQRLARVLGMNVDSWLGSKVDQAVAELKVPAGGAPIVSTPPQPKPVTISGSLPVPSPRHPT